MGGVKPGGSAGFYADLVPVQQYRRLSDAKAYRRAPGDWRVVVCDIEGSTKAVAAGRYKDVNMLGSACITAALNVCGDIAIAYEFGGDGATLLVPERLIGKLSGALCALQQYSVAIYGMKLRVGAVPLADIRARGADVRLARYQLSKGNFQAMFSGGGVALADDLIKADDRYALHAPISGPPDLTGLSCRWEPLQSKNGTMVTLLVLARGAEQEIRDQQYARALETIEDVTGNLAGLAPANEASLKFRWPPRYWRLEAVGLGGGHVSFKQMMIIWTEAAFQKIGHKFGLKFGDYNAPVYKEELKTNTDYRRFGDMIRLVLDCKSGADKDLRRALDGLEERGEIIYGLHISQDALMTCLVFNLARSRHIHFIDGGNGGFTLAATELKKKMKSSG